MLNRPGPEARSTASWAGMAAVPAVLWESLRRCGSHRRRCRSFRSPPSPCRYSSPRSSNSRGRVLSRGPISGVEQGQRRAHRDRCLLGNLRRSRGRCIPRRSLRRMHAPPWPRSLPRADRADPKASGGEQPSRSIQVRPVARQGVIHRARSGYQPPVGDRRLRYLGSDEKGSARNRPGASAPCDLARQVHSRMGSCRLLLPIQPTPDPASLSIGHGRQSRQSPPQPGCQ
jgi:hypothetical protein